MTEAILPLLSSAFSMGIFYAVFCRAVHMRPGLPWGIKLPYAVLGALSGMLSIAPIVPSLAYQPDWYLVGLLGSFLAVLVSMRRSWYDGIPRS